MRQRQEAAKLFIAGMYDNTMRDWWVADEEWVRHIIAYGNDIGIHDMNMGISQRCDWCNNQFIIDGYLLLHNVKAIHDQMKDPKKIKKMRFYYVISLGQLAPTIPSVQKFYQDLWNDRKMSKRSLKQSAQDDCLKQEQPSNKKKHDSSFRGLFHQLQHWTYWFLNKLAGDVRGAIRGLDLQREESSESSVWDVDIQINWISRVRKYRSDANLF
jgi:hypothetical protein